MVEPPHLLHSISGPVLAQAGAPAFLASTPCALVLAQAGAPALLTSVPDVLVLAQVGARNP